MTSRGQCFRGRDELESYLRQVIPGGLTDGSVHYRVQSVHPVSDEVAAVIVEQTYLAADGKPRDSKAQHTHTYVIALGHHGWRIVVGQNTVRRES